MNKDKIIQLNPDRPQEAITIHTFSAFAGREVVTLEARHIPIGRIDNLIAALLEVKDAYEKPVIQVDMQNIFRVIHHIAMKNTDSQVRHILNCIAGVARLQLAHKDNQPEMAKTEDGAFFNHALGKAMSAEVYQEPAPIIIGGSFDWDANTCEPAPSPTFIELPYPDMPAAQSGTNIVTIAGVKAKDWTRFGVKYTGKVDEYAHADISKGKWIRIYGLLPQERDYNRLTRATTAFRQVYDLTFKIGDTCVYDSFNIIYTGSIVSISEKTIAIDRGAGYSKKVMLDIATFIRRNQDYDARRIESNNEAERRF